MVFVNLNKVIELVLPSVVLVYGLYCTLNLDEGVIKMIAGPFDSADTELGGFLKK
jgi:hypothetical protein